MVRLTRIYTRGGDKGKTSLGDGSRISKTAIRVQAYGTVDEANAVIGVARLHADGETDTLLSRVQNDLFDLGADLATPQTPDPKYPPLRVVASQVKRLEAEIDRMNAELKPLDSFILPGGSALAAFLHQARTVVRRAERETVALAELEPINPLTIQYLNRLSDHLFVLSRFVNERGATDVLWVPGANR